MKKIILVNEGKVLTWKNVKNSEGFKQLMNELKGHKDKEVDVKIEKLKDAVEVQITIRIKVEPQE